MRSAPALTSAIPSGGTGCVSVRRKKRPVLPTFRDTIVEIAKQRNDELGRRVLLNIGEETDLPALDAQYHVRCYNLFRPVNHNVDVSPDNVVDDPALKSCINVMYAGQNRLYSHTERHLCWL